ncbi:MAG: serine/threonine phosphatase PrpC [Labilithrix sp.]|nr:serine/threonine phosphatase PrpC [Labilithrix sp.]
MTPDNALPIAIAVAVLFFAVYLIVWWWLRQSNLARRAAEQKREAERVLHALAKLREPAPVPEPAATPVPAPAATPSLPPVVSVHPLPATPPEPAVIRIDEDDDGEVEPAPLGSTRKKGVLAPPTQTIVYDEDAAIDEPTHAGALFLVTGIAQTDKGLRRKNNEDSVLAREDEGLFVVADGMGGYRGGEIASSVAVATIERAFVTKTFEGPVDEAIPRRASELVRAIQMANEAILERAEGDQKLTGMGTTICAARFSANKQRLYVGHVGDSRLYLFRSGKLRQMTSDHTMKDLGVTGEGSDHLSRAVGVWPVVPIDILFAKPQPGDVYMLCSDGLTKMASDEEIGAVLAGSATPKESAQALVKLANDHGGKDNVSVIVVRVDEPATAKRPGNAAA